MHSIFPLLRCQRNLKKTWKNTCAFHLYCSDHVRKVNEWCLVDCFHSRCRVLTQIMVHNYCIAKCKKFSACGKLLMALHTIFFTIQNIYNYSNPAPRTMVELTWQRQGKSCQNIIFIQLWLLRKVNDQLPIYS